MPTIYVDNDVFTELQKRAIPLVDNPNSVMRKLLGLDGKIVSGDRGKIFEIPVKDYAIKYGLIPVARSNRQFFPGLKMPFGLETGVGNFEVKVSNGDKDSPIGDPDAGGFITGGLKKFYQANPTLKSGDVLRFEILEMGKRYKLTIIRK